ncbi:hypothetical protein Fcan01_20151 [Folsomia candida]|uniref:Uncharacterized protein n=1 Tax=Folsomia candida TaxID=158441 RepID=A0A226DIY4_FOLCA|nr:hypothetical protein Fcan01_20151 [Folsomia candida]
MNIVPQKSLKLIQRSVKFSLICKTLPFQRIQVGNVSIYKTCIRRPSLKGGVPVRMFLCWMNLLFQLFGGSFSTYRMIWAMFFLGGFEHVSVLDIGFVTYQSVGFGIAAVFLITVWRKHDEYLAFLNLLVMNPAKPKEKLESTFSKMIPWLIPAVYGQSLCNILLFVRRHHGVQYIWGMLDLAWQTSTTFAIHMLYEFLIPMNSWNVVLFVFFTYSSYTHYLGVHLKKFGKKREILVSSNLKACRTYSLSYRQLQIVDKLYHSCYGAYIIPMANSVLLFLVSWMSFATFKLSKNGVLTVSQPSSFIFPLGTFALSIMAFCINSEGQLLFEGSRYLITEWRKCKIMKRMRLVQSFAPLKAHIGSLYFLKRSSPLTFISNTMGLTINLLLTF